MISGIFEFLLVLRRSGGALFGYWETIPCLVVTVQTAGMARPPHNAGLRRRRYTSDGHFALVQMRSDLLKLASNSRDRGTPEENKAVVQGSTAYFGTYAVNESEKVITLQLEGSTFANLAGGGEQKRLITSITADELKFVMPKTPSGSTLEVGWKRAR